MTDNSCDHALTAVKEDPTAVKCKKCSLEIDAEKIYQLTAVFSPRILFDYSVWLYEVSLFERDLGGRIIDAAVQSIIPQLSMEERSLLELFTELKWHDSKRSRKEQLERVYGPLIKDGLLRIKEDLEELELTGFGLQVAGCLIE